MTPRTFLRIYALVFMIVLCALPTVSVGQDYRLSRLQDETPSSGDAFSQGIAASDSEIFVGIPNYDYFLSEKVGVVRVFKKNNLGEWHIVQTLFPELDVQSQLSFGKTLYYHNGQLFVSTNAHVRFQNLTRQNAGSVECYNRDAHGRWIHFASITCLRPYTGDRFGDAVACDGEWLAIASPYNDHDVNEQDPLVNSGAVYLYQKEDTGWVFHRKLTSGIRRENLQFGRTLSLRGKMLFASSFIDRAYGFHHYFDRWESMPITDPTHPAQYSFGLAMAQGQFWLAIGAPSVINTASDTVGAVYIYRKEGPKLRFKGKIKPHADLRVGFGQSLGVMGDKLVVGAPNTNYWNNWGSGCVYIYQLQANLKDFLIDSFCQEKFESGTFARKLAASRTMIVANSPSAAYQDSYGRPTIGATGAAYLIDYSPKKEHGECPVLFPNPTSDILRFYPYSASEELRIFDLTGHRMEVPSDLERWDVSHLSQGMYVVRFGECSYRLMRN